MSKNNNNSLPFPGPRPYLESESSVFYAREKEVEDVLNILQRHKLVVISGESGSGKTSLINAGVLPLLKSRFSGQAGKDWVVCNFRPGVSPIENFAHALSHTGVLYLNEKAKTTDKKNYTSIIEDKKDLALIDIYGNSEINEKKNLLIVIDQLEDLFKYTEHFDYAESLNDNILFDLIYRTSKYKETAIYFILAIQANYTSKLNYYERFTEILNSSHYTIPKLGSTGIREIIEKTFHKRNVQLSDDLIESMGDSLKENVTLLPNINFFLKELYSAHAAEIPEDILFVDAFFINEFGDFSTLFQDEIESFYSNLSDQEKRCLELLMRSMILANTNGNSVSYQTINYIYEYSKLQDQINPLIKKVRSNFGDSLDIFKSIFQGGNANRQNNFSKNDIITLKYQTIYSWGRFKEWQKEEEKFYLIFKENYEKSKKYPKESLLTAKSLDSASLWLDNKLINDNWSKKYSFDFHKTVNYIKESQRVRDRELKKAEGINKDILNAKKRAKKLQWGVFIIFFLSALLLIYERHKEAEKLAIFATQMEEKKALAEREKEKAEILNRDIIKLRTKDSLDNIKREEEQKLRLSMIQKQLLSQKKMVSLKMLIDEQENKLESKRIRIFQDSLRAEKILSIAEEQSENAGDSQEFIELKESLSSILYTLKNTSVNEYDKVLLGELSSSSLDHYERIKYLGNKLDRDYDGDDLRQISVLLLAKLNGKNQYAEIEKYELIQSNKQPLRALNISMGGKIASGGESKKLYTNLNSVNKIEELNEIVQFKSNINAIEFINENVVAVGLENSSIWLVRLDTKEKSRIFNSKGWRPGRVIKDGARKMKSLFRNLIRGINFLKFSSQNKKLIASLEKELIIIDINEINYGENKYMKRLSFDNLETDEVIVSMSFSDSNNTVFMVTNLGNAILFNLNTNKVLKFNDQLLNIKNETAVEIEFYSGTVFIGTQEGSIYIYDYQKNNSLKYVNSIRANFSKINDLLYDQKNIHVITENGDLTVIPYSKNGSNSDEVKIKTPVSINFGDNNFGNAIESFTYGGVQYFVTADRSGNLVYWDLDLESTFDEIKKIHAEKYNDM